MTSGERRLSPQAACSLASVVATFGMLNRVAFTGAFGEAGWLEGPQ
jgi:hypothetical protein